MSKHVTELKFTYNLCLKGIHCHGTHGTLNHRLKISCFILQNVLFCILTNIRQNPVLGRMEANVCVSNSGVVTMAVIIWSQIGLKTSFILFRAILCWEAIKDRIFHWKTFITVQLRLKSDSVVTTPSTGLACSSVAYFKREGWVGQRVASSINNVAYKQIHVSQNTHVLLKS